ncbi:MAG: GntR family transcriptional regulator [Negativibacillus sp.]|nr:GntR family transcriptional regulator [Negativibacillus sp.]
MAKLNYKTLRQEVADEIRKKILSGEFEAGQRIKENEIAELFGVSRGPVREALRQIEQEGLITYERNIGCSVTHITQRDLDEISWLRATLEMLAVRLCRGEISSEALKQMQESLERMRSLGEDRYQLAQEDNLFHGCVIGQIGFHKLAHIWKSTDLSNFPAFCMQRSESQESFCQRHQQLLDCYRSGSVAQICQELERHYGVGQADDGRPNETV